MHLDSEEGKTTLSGGVGWGVGEWAGTRLCLIDSPRDIITANQECKDHVRGCAVLGCGPTFFVTTMPADSDQSSGPPDPVVRGDWEFSGRRAGYRYIVKYCKCNPCQPSLRLQLVELLHPYIMNLELQILQKPKPLTFHPYGVRTSLDAQVLSRITPLLAASDPTRPCWLSRKETA